jgi:hypothetical protein
MGIVRGSLLLVIWFIVVVVIFHWFVIYCSLLLFLNIVIVLCYCSWFIVIGHMVHYCCHSVHECCHCSLSLFTLFIVIVTEGRGALGGNAGGGGSPRDR